ncbi:MAG: hypothetical protein JKY65_19640 [Planctomycetes bacterium]|nr:hypothetical protein [Planctomycetota bacterium]
MIRRNLLAHTLLTSCLLATLLVGCSKDSDKFVTVPGGPLPGGGSPATGGSGSGSSASGFGATVTAPASAGSVQLTVAMGSTVAVAQAQQVGTPVLVGPAGTTFKSPVTLVLKYDPAKVTDPSTLVVLRRNDATNEVSILAPIAVDTRNSTVTVQTSSFSTFMPAVLPAKAHLQGTYTVIGHLSQVSTVPDGQVANYIVSGTRGELVFDGSGSMTFSNLVEKQATLKQRAGAPGSTGASITTSTAAAPTPTWAYDYDPRTGRIAITAAGETTSGARSLDGSVVVVSATRFGASGGTAAATADLMVGIKQHSVTGALSGLAGLDAIGSGQELSTLASVDSDAIGVAFISHFATSYTGSAGSLSAAAKVEDMNRLNGNSTLNVTPTPDTYLATTVSVTSTTSASLSFNQAANGQIDGATGERGAINSSGSVLAWESSMTVSVGSEIRVRNDLYLAFPPRTDHAQADIQATWNVFGVNRELSAQAGGSEARLELFVTQGASLGFTAGGTWAFSSSGEIIRRLNTTVGAADDTLSGQVSIRTSGASGTGTFNLNTNGQFTLVGDDQIGLLSADNSLFVLQTGTGGFGRQIWIGVRRPSVPQ